MKKNPRLFTRTREIWATLNLTVWCSQSDYLLYARFVTEQMEGVFCDDFPDKSINLVAIYGTSVFPKVPKLSTLD